MSQSQLTTGGVQIKPSVIFMSTVFGSGKNGPAMYAKYLADALLTDPDVDFHLVSSDIALDASKTHQVKAESDSFSFYRQLQKKTLDLANSFHLPPIIHTNNAHATRMMKNYKGPVIVQINDYMAATALQKPLSKIRRYGLKQFIRLNWRRRNEKTAVSFCDSIICNSQFTKSQIECSYTNVKRGQIKVIYKAVDVEFFSTLARPSPNLEPNLGDSHRILFLGTNSKTKGLDIAIKAMRLVLESYPKSILMVAGKEGSRSDLSIKRLPTQLGIESSVKFLGPLSRQQLYHLFRKCDLMTLPSREEALGVAILEALAAGLPVIGTSVGGIPEILKRCKHSILIPPNNPTILAQAVINMLSTSTDSSAVRSEGLSVANDFSKNIMIKKIKDLYLKTHQLRYQG